MKLLIRLKRFASVLQEALPTRSLWKTLGKFLVGTGLAILLSVPLSHFSAEGWTLARYSAVARWSGMLLQIFGILSVAVGLSQARQIFGRPPFHKTIFVWFQRLVRALVGPQRIDASVGLASGASMTVVGSGRAIMVPGPNASVNERLSALERRVIQLQRDLDEAFRATKTASAETLRKLEEESDTRRTADKETSRQMEEFAIGGIHLDTVGLFWLFFGVVGTSLPDEIAKLVCS